MNWQIRSRTWPAGLVMVAFAIGVVWPLFGQASQPAGAAPAAADGPYRILAPGVMESIDPAGLPEETVSRHDIIELLAVDPGLDCAKDVAFRRDIWYLEFEFKPVRMIWVDIPQASGRMRRKLLWYMVYSVTNSGKAMHPEEDADGTYKVVEVDKPVRFVPQFLLYSSEVGKAYPDRVIPAAMGPIRMREDPRRTFLNSVQMTRQIEVGQTLWGVAIWENVDPLIDRFCIYVSGLTNAYKWKDDPDSYDPNDPLRKDRQLLRKTLKLNFWRPGDDRHEHEGEIRYGIPGEVDHDWVYIVERGFAPCGAAHPSGVPAGSGKAASGD